uniref:DDRGK domain-containing protein 1 n=1 Tax=Ditylenchus dipsaci TaxID=166011 RepID=A0A915D2K3_9BILA
MEAMCADGAAENNEEVRRRPRRQLVNRTADGDSDEEEDVRDQHEIPSFPTSDEPKIGKKKLAKLQAKAEAKAHREQEQTERQERKKQDEIKQKQEEIERLEQEVEEQKKRDKLKAEREERERKELEEYQKLKETFTLDDQAFIDHIKQKKVVHVDELASHFSLSAEDVVKSFSCNSLFNNCSSQQARMVVEQLRREKNVHRGNISHSINEIVRKI